MGLLILMVVISGGIALMMQVMAERVESGQMQPNMGHHTQASTTPESWEAMRVAIVHTLRVSARIYAAAVLLMLVVAALSGSTLTGGTFGGGAISLATVPVVMGSLRASNLLVSNGSITR